MMADFVSGKQIAVMRRSFLYLTPVLMHLGARSVTLGLAACHRRGG